MTDNDFIRQMLGDFIGPVIELLDSDGVQEVMINRHDEIWVERLGRMERADAELSESALRAAIGLLARETDKDAVENTESAIVDTRIGESRVAAVLKPTAVRGDAMSIRKHSTVEIPLSEYAAAVVGNTTHQPDPEPDPSIDAESAEAWLRWSVAHRKNVLISGGTSSGKTTFFKAYLTALPEEERIVVIEDVPELKVGVPNKVFLMTNKQAGLTMSLLVKLSLRFRPDRIVVGEIRGAEAFDLLQAMNTGHDGGVASIHANSAKDALGRLETLVLTAGTDWPLEAIRNQIASTIDYVIHMARIQGNRVIAEIMRLDGFDGRDYQVSHLINRL